MIRAPLMTKIEHADSLTQSAESDYDSARRKEDRQLVWAKVEEWRRNGQVEPVSLDLPTLAIDFVSNPTALNLRSIPMTERTRKIAQDLLEKYDCPPAVPTQEAAE